MPTTRHTSGCWPASGKLRQLITSAVPDAGEQAYPGWRGIGYRRPNAGYFCAVFLHQDLVKLGLDYSALLSDQADILKPGPSADQQVRYVEIAGEKDIDREVIESLLKAAIELRARY